MQVFFQFDQSLFGFTNFLDRHFAHVRVVVLEQRLGAFKVGLHFEPLRVSGNNGFNFRVFLGIGAEFGLIGNDFAIAKQCGQFFKTVLEDVQFIKQ